MYRVSHVGPLKSRAEVCETFVPTIFAAFLLALVMKYRPKTDICTHILY